MVTLITLTFMTLSFMDIRGGSDFYPHGKVQRADLTCDVIKKVAPLVLSKL